MIVLILFEKARLGLVLCFFLISLVVVTWKKPIANIALIDLLMR